MKKLRKMLCFVMVLVLAMGFVGCSGLDMDSLDDEKFIEESAAKILYPVWQDLSFLGCLFPHFGRS